MTSGRKFFHRVLKVFVISIIFVLLIYVINGLTGFLTISWSEISENQKALTYFSELTGSNNIAYCHTHGDRIEVMCYAPDDDLLKKFNDVSDEMANYARFINKAYIKVIVYPESESEKNSYCMPSPDMTLYIYPNLINDAKLAVDFCEEFSKNKESTTGKLIKMLDGKFDNITDLELWGFEEIDYSVLSNFPNLKKLSVYNHDIPTTEFSEYVPDNCVIKRNP